MFSVSPRVYAAIVLLLVGACGDSDSDVPRCVPGESQACTCTDGRTGAQDCDDDGRFESCICDGPMDAGGEPDAAVRMDSGTADASSDDGATADAGPRDASAADGGPIDAGPPPSGHLVLIGHFYGVESTNEDRMLCNAVLVSERGDDIAVLQYTEHIDSGWDVPSRVAPMLSSCAGARGRSVSFGEMTNFADLATMLSSHDVLLVYHQMTATREKMSTVSTAWNATLNDFLDDGGVIVVIDDSGVGSSSSGGTFLIASGTGLMNVSSVESVVGDPLVVAASSDPVADGVSDYMAPTGSSGYPLSTGGTVVIHERDSLVPVVRHLVRDAL